MKKAALKTAIPLTVIVLLLLINTLFVNANQGSSGMGSSKLVGSVSFKGIKSAISSRTEGVPTIVTVTQTVTQTETQISISVEGFTATIATSSKEAKLANLD